MTQKPKTRVTSWFIILALIFSIPGCGGETNENLQAEGGLGEPVIFGPPDTTLPSDTAPPTTPTGLSATSVSSSQVNLSWNASIDNVGVPTYKVYRDGTEVATVLSGTSYQDTNLTPNTTYTYTVAAYDQAGNSSIQVASLNVTTLASPDTTPPSVPANLQASGITTTSVTISWSASTDNVAVAGYDVIRNGTQVATVTSGTSYQNTNLTPNTTYAYTVTAYDQAGNRSAPSAPVNTITLPLPDIIPPTVPTNLQASNITTTSVTLSWGPSSDNVGVVGYRVFRNGTQVATVTSGTSYPDTNLTPNTTYAYSVCTYDQAGNNSPQTAPLNVITLPLPDTTPPSVPTNLVASGITSTSMLISWSASTDNVVVAGYRIFRNGTQVATVTSGTSYQNTNLTPATAYTYTIRAYDQAGNNSAQSSPLSATTLPPPDTTPPSVPTNLAASGITSTSVTISWSASTDNVGVVGYRIYRNGTQVAATTPGTSYQDTNLTANTTYAYTVSAYDQAGNSSAQSISLYATTSGTPPPPVYSVTLAWDAPTTNVDGSPLTNLAGYWLYYGTTSGVFTTNINIGNVTTYTIANLPYGTYYFAVKAYNSANNFSEYSSPTYGLCVNVDAIPIPCPW